MLTPRKRKKREEEKRKVRREKKTFVEAVSILNIDTRLHMGPGAVTTGEVTIGN